MTKTSKAAAASSSCKIATEASKKDSGHREPTKKEQKKPKVVPAEKPEKPKRQVKKTLSA